MENQFSLESAQVEQALTTNLNEAFHLLGPILTISQLVIFPKY